MKNDDYSEYTVNQEKELKRNRTYTRALSAAACIAFVTGGCAVFSIITKNPEAKDHTLHLQSSGSETVTSAESSLSADGFLISSQTSVTSVSSDVSFTVSDSFTSDQAEPEAETETTGSDEKGDSPEYTEPPEEHHAVTTAANHQQHAVTTPEVSRTTPQPAVTEPHGPVITESGDGYYIADDTADSGFIFRVNTNENSAHIVRYQPASVHAELFLPDNFSGMPVVEIEGDTFSCRHGIREVIIPSSVRSVGNNAFLRCYDLEKVVFSDCSAEIGSLAFFESPLKTIDFGSGNLRIRQNAFSNTDITELTVTSRMIFEEDGVFSGCRHLQKVTINQDTDLSAAFTGINTFYNCQELNSVEYTGHDISELDMSQFTGTPFQITVPVS